jgi:hypothetical protein
MIRGRSRPSARWLPPGLRLHVGHEVGDPNQQRHAAQIACRHGELSAADQVEPDPDGLGQQDAGKEHGQGLLAYLDDVR